MGYPRTGTNFIVCNRQCSWAGHLWRTFVRPHIENAQDVAVIQRACGACFLLEPFQSLRVARKRCRQYFHCDIASQPCIARAIHLAHPTRANGLENFVRAKLETRTKSHRGCDYTRSYPTPNRLTDDLDDLQGGIAGCKQ